jgi:hypothetical protein
MHPEQASDLFDFLHRTCPRQRHRRRNYGRTCVDEFTRGGGRLCEPSMHLVSLSAFRSLLCLFVIFWLLIRPLPFRLLLPSPRRVGDPLLPQYANRLMWPRPASAMTMTDRAYALAQTRWRSSAPRPTCGYYHRVLWLGPFPLSELFAYRARWHLGRGLCAAMSP